MENKISKKYLIYYGILAMPLAFAGIPLYIFAPDFYATTYGVPLSTLGILLLLLRIVDAVQDPIIGILSDKYAIKRGVIIAISTILLAFSFYFLFDPLSNLYVLWFGVFVLLSTTSFSIITVNLNTMGGLWTKDKNQKTTIASYREVLGLIGLLLSVSLPSVFQNYMSKQQSFQYLSIILIILSLIALSFYLIWQKKHSYINEYKSTEKLDFTVITKMPLEIRQFFLIYGVSMVASSIPAVLLLFFVRDRLNLESYAGIFLLAYFIAGGLGITFWQYLSRKIGKYNTWLCSMILAVCSFVWAYFLGEGDLWQFMIICAASGLAFGAELIMPSSILADHINENNKEHQASLHFGALAFLAKLSLALASGLSLLFLDSTGFKAGGLNSAYALQSLSISYAAIPCAIKLLSVYLLFKTKKK